MGYCPEEDQGACTKDVGVKILTIKPGCYKIKKRYSLKDLSTGWFVYSRHILGRYIGSVTPLNKELRNSRRYRVSRGFATRRGAIRAAANLKRKSDAFILSMVKEHEISK